MYYGIEFIPQLSKVAPVYDSLQVRVLDGFRRCDGEHPKLDTFIGSLMKGYKLKVQKFSDYENARYYKSWGYVSTDPLPATDSVLHNVLDMRLSCAWEDKDIVKMARSFAQCYEETFLA